jgi:hypothetical protein
MCYVNLTQDVDKWWAVVDVLMTIGFHKMWGVS